MSIAFGGIVAFFFRGLNLIVAGGTILLSANVLDAGPLGVFVLSLTVVGVVTAITNGLTAATAFQVSNRGRPPGVALANGTVTGAGLALLVIAAGVAGSVLLDGSAGRVAMPVGFIASAIILNSVLAGVFLGDGAMFRYNSALVLPPFLSLVGIAAAFFALDSRDPDVALTAYALGQWVATLLVLASGGRTLRTGIRFERGMPLAIFTFALLAGASTVVSYLSYRADVFVVEQFEGVAGVGVYSVAVYLAESVWQVSGSLSLAAYARVGSATRQEAAMLTTRVMRHSLVLLAILCLGIFAVADVVQALFFPNQEGMANALRLLLPGVVLYSLAQAFSGFYTFQAGKPWIAGVVAGLSLALNLAVAVLLVPRLGVNGAAIASSTAKGVTILIAVAVFLRREHLSPAEVFRFTQSDLRDYVDLIGRVRSAMLSRRAPTPEA